MRKTILSLAAGVFLAGTIGAAPLLANENGCYPLNADGKLEIDLQMNGCSVQIKASSDLPNACVAGPFSIVVTNDIYAETVGFLLVGDGGSCFLLSDVDDDGNAQAKASCKNNGNSKIEILLTSCFVVGPG